MTSAGSRKGPVRIVPSGRVGCGRRERGRDRAEDLHDVPVTYSTHVAEGGVEVSRCFGVSGRRGSGPTEELPHADDRRAPLPIGEQAEVADAHEAAREHMQQKAPQEFLDAERHDLRAAPIGVVLPPKLDDAIGETDESRVRDRDSVRITTEILEHLRWPAKRSLRVDDPGRCPELRDEGGEPGRVGERRRPGGEGQSILLERALESRQVFGAEDDRERFDRKQKRRAPADPVGAVARQGAARDQTVDVQMLPPAPTIPRA